MAHDSGELSDAIPLRQEFLDSSPTDNGQGRMKWIMVSSLALVVGVFAGAATVGYSQGQRSYLMKTDIYTTGGVAHEDSHCHFPFGWNDVWYNECTEVDSGRPGVAWCSVDDDDDQPDHSNAWGYCKDPVLVLGGEGTGTPQQYVALNDEPVMDDIFINVGGEGTGTPQQDVTLISLPELPPPGEEKIVGGNGDAGVDNPLNCCFTCGYIWCHTLGPVGVGKCVKDWEEPCPDERGEIHLDPVVLPTLVIDPLPTLVVPEFAVLPAPTGMVVLPDAGEIIAADKDGKQISSIDDMVEFFPWIAGSDGVFHPICGHEFWDNDDGAVNFCRRLGFLSGSVVHEMGGFMNLDHIRHTFEVDAMPVGQCHRGEPLTSCTAAGNHFDNLDAEYFLGANCHAGQEVGFKVSCIGKQAEYGTSSGEVDSFICAEQLLIGAQTCHCDGAVKFGNAVDGWSESKDVDVSIQCDRGNFIKDVLDPIVPILASFGNAHVCLCDLS